jgi:polysaccharide biosynthesis transport protein
VEWSAARLRYSSMDPDLRTDVSLRDYLEPLRARWWLVLGLVVLVTGGTYAWYSHKPDVFKASTKIYVAQEANPLLGVNAGFSDARTVENQATLLTSTDVARVVARRISYQGDPNSLLGRVSAVPSGSADFITITGTGRTGREAAAIANGFARAFIDARAGERRAQIAKALAQFRKQLRDLPTTRDNASARTEIEGNIRQLQVASSTSPGTARQIDPALPPAVAAAPRPKHKALLALPIALLGSILLAYFLFRLDTRLRRPEEAEEIYGRPILARVAHDTDVARFEGGGSHASAATRESFRELRVNLALAAPDDPYRVVLVTSASPGEGKTTVARQLALALHEAGRSVALVDADLRKPTLPRSLGIEAGRGLTDVVSGEAKLDDVLLDVDVAAPSVAANGDARGGSRLMLLPSGAEPPDPSAVLESAATAEILRDLATRVEVVIVDTAPLLAVTDAVTLMRNVNAVVLVSRAGVTDRRGARRAAETIGRVPDANLVGVVSNDLQGPEASAYGSRYGYGYVDGGRRDDAPAPVSARE